MRDLSTRFRRAGRLGACLVAALSRGEWGAALGPGLVWFVVYLRTLCPSTYLGDSGEIANAITTGGIVHPPGYPLFSVLGKLALWLIPVGEPAYRIGCVTAAAAAAATAVLFALAREAGCSRAGAWFAAGLLGGSYTFWSQSVRVEVYSLHVLLSLLLLVGAARYHRTGARRDLLIAAAATALGLAHHLTIVLLGLAALVLCGRRLWTDPRPGSRLVPALLCVAAGPTLYFLVFLWARADPVYNWGRPGTFPLLWNHATAVIYRFGLRAPDAAFLGTSLPLFWQLLLDQFPYYLSLLAIPGAWYVWRRRPAHCVAILTAALVVVGYNQCYRIADIAPYYLLVWALLALLLGAGLDLLGEWLAAPVWRCPVRALGVVLIGVALPVGRNWAACDLSRATWVREFARQKLECTPPGGVLVGQWDPDVFPMWYVQNVLGVRRDVLVLDRSLIRIGCWNSNNDPSLWYLHILRRQGAPIALPISRALSTRIREGDDGLLFRLLTRELRERPWCMTFGYSGSAPPYDRQYFPLWVQRNMYMMVRGVVIGIYPIAEAPAFSDVLRDNDTLWGRINLPEFAGVRLDQDLAPSYVQDHYVAMYLQYARLLLRAGRRAETARICGRLHAWAPNSRPVQDALEWLRTHPE